MSGLLIPDDWDEQADGYTFLVAQAPNSPLWRASVRGSLFFLTREYQWDAETGDQAAAAARGKDIFDSIGFGVVDGGNA